MRSSSWSCVQSCESERWPVAESAHTVPSPCTSRLASQPSSATRALTPPHLDVERRDYAERRRADAARGWSQYGRVLARRHGVRWQEYWAFLDAWCVRVASQAVSSVPFPIARSPCLICSRTHRVDLASPAGLAALDAHLGGSAFVAGAAPSSHGPSWWALFHRGHHIAALTWFIVGSGWGGGACFADVMLVPVALLCHFILSPGPTTLGSPVRRR